MKKSAPMILLISGVFLTLISIFLEVKFKNQLLHSSISIQRALTKTPPHGLHYFFKIFEWAILGFTWFTLMVTLYLEFNKLTSWKLLIAVWDLSLCIDFVRLLMTGSRPVFHNKILAHNGCDCTFGSPSWYTAFLLVFWVLFYQNVLKNREVIKVGFFPTK